EVVERIRVAESRTSGEIKVHIETRCPGGDAMARARALVDKLGLAKTRHRNGGLLYIAVKNRKFAVLGDQGVHERATQALWDQVARELSERFRAGDYRAGLLAAVERVGAVLAEHFPPDPDGDQPGAHPVSNEISGR